MLRFVARLSFVVWVGLLIACSSGGGTSENEIPDYVPDGNYNPATDGDQIDGDAQELPACQPICRNYCDKLRNCAPPGTLPGETYAQCLQTCDSIPQTGRYDQRISCALRDNCSSYDACRDNGGDKDFACETNPQGQITDGDGIDGDQNPGDGDATDGDLVSDGDVELPEDFCQGEMYCPPATHCDPILRRCMSECDPLSPACPQGEACKVITKGENAGKGYAVCIPAWDGPNEGEPCSGTLPCDEGLACGATGRCEQLCTSGNDAVCKEGLSCKDNDELGLYSCMYCSSRDDCEDEKKCIGGYCSDGVACGSADDCQSGEGCFNGYCDDGCSSNADCSGGQCLTDAAYCYDDSCEENCAAQGLCCNRTSCGPCCSQTCNAPETCMYHPDCYPDLNCCTKPVDCREKPLGYCGYLPCDRLTGACKGSCPAEGCRWGYECGPWTGYICKPKPVVGCDSPGFCEEESCMQCDMAQCIATNACGIAYLEEGFSCSSMNIGLPCGMGMTCCMVAGGSRICCETDKCRPGVGCETFMDDDDPAATYTCPDCDAMEGTYTKQNGGTCSPPWDTVIVERDAYYPCYFIVYHSDRDWSHRLEEPDNCDTQVIYRDDAPAGYDSCMLFWDEAQRRFVYNCKGSGGSCQSLFTP